MARAVSGRSSVIGALGAHWFLPEYGLPTSWLLGRLVDDHGLTVGTLMAGVVGVVALMRVFVDDFVSDDARWVLVLLAKQTEGCHGRLVVDRE